MEGLRFAFIDERPFGYRDRGGVTPAHLACLAQADGGSLEMTEVPEVEKLAEAGAFACRKAALARRVNGFLRDFVGSSAHEELVARFTG